CAILFSQRLFIATLPVFFIFLFLPVEVDLRSDVKGDDVFTTLLTFVHGVDQPYNAWPSLHVAHSLAVVLCVPLVFKINKFALAMLWIAWMLLVLSTMTTQQHYLFDVITGIMYSLIVYRSWLRPVLAECIAGAYDDSFQPR
ncbi:MAG: phosphatase PAP2 family protein, partial [Candidatus Poseidoniaceae archaeon]